MKVNILLVLFLIIGGYGMSQDSLLHPIENNDSTAVFLPQEVGNADVSQPMLNKVENGVFRDNVWYRIALITYYGDSIKIIDQMGAYQYGTYFLKEDGKYWKKDNVGNYIIVTEAGLLKVYYGDFTGNEFNERYHWKRLLL